MTLEKLYVPTGSEYYKIGTIGEDLQVYLRIWPTQWGSAYSGAPTIFSYRLRIQTTGDHPGVDMQTLVSFHGIDITKWPSKQYSHCSYTGGLLLVEQHLVNDLYNSVKEAQLFEKLYSELSLILPSMVYGVPQREFREFFSNQMVSMTPKVPDTLKLPLARIMVLEPIEETAPPKYLAH